VGTPGSSFSVSYEAAPDCPNRATFEAAILARSPGAKRVEAEAEVRFEASLPGGGHGARLKVELQDGTSQDREIVAEGCAEAMQSMAVIAAMILDAQPRAASPGVQAAPPTQPPLPAAKTQAPDDVPSRFDVPRSRLDVTFAGNVESSAAPSLAWGGSAGLQLSRATSGHFSASARLSLVAAQAPRARTPVGDARFRLLLARSHLCAVRVEAWRLEARLCAVVEAGALFGQGLDARNERDQTMPWIGAGLGALSSVQLSGPWAVELAGGARGLVVHDQFVFQPDTLIHEVPVFAWNSSLGLTLRIR
jgi:hypothetical protein